MRSLGLEEALCLTKKSRAKLLSFEKDLKEMGAKRDMKVMRGDDPLLEKALYIHMVPAKKVMEEFLLQVHYCMKRL